MIHDTHYIRFVTNIVILATTMVEDRGVFMSQESTLLYKNLVIVGKKLTILRQITLNRVQNLSVFLKIMQTLQIFG